MAGVKDISPDLGRLDSHLDDLEDELSPLLNNLEELSSQLPLLDKANVEATLKLEGNNSQGQEVLSELKRIQQYFAKIKSAEEPEAARTLTVNQEAAARVLKADLGDNKAVATKLAEKIAEERAKALLKDVQGKKRAAEKPESAPAEVPSNEGQTSKQGAKKRDNSKKDKQHHQKKKSKR